MANLNITIGSRFRPYSFDEYLKPYQIYGLTYNQQELALSELESKAATYELIAMDEPNSMAARMYKLYSDNIKQAVDNLAEGLSPKTRKSVTDLRTMYNRQIVPIERAIQRKQALADEQRKLMALNPTLRFDNDFSKPYIGNTNTLDAIISNPELSYLSLSGRDIMANTATMAKSLALSIVNNPTYSKVLGSQYFQQRLQLGYTPELIILEATGDNNAPKELQNIRKTIISLVADNAAFDENWVNSYINLGMYLAIGSSKYDLLKNADYIDAATERRLLMAENEFNAKYKPDGEGGYKLRTPTIVPTPDGGALDTRKNILYDSEGKIKAVGVTEVNKALGNDSTNKKEKLKFTSLDYTGKGFNTPGTTDEFSVSDSKLYDKGKLTPVLRKKLERDLLPYGLTINDVDIYEDKDIFSRNHYRVVPKGYDVNGELLETLDFN